MKLSIIDYLKKITYIWYMNDKIKESIISFLNKKGLLKENTYQELSVDSEKLKKIRSIINDSLLECKRNIIKSNINLLNERIFKDDYEGAIQVITNTNDKTFFYDYLDSINDLLLNSQKYEKCFSDETTYASTIKDNFFLEDQQVVDLLNEIYLDNK